MSLLSLKVYLYSKQECVGEELIVFTLSGPNLGLITCLMGSIIRALRKLFLSLNRRSPETSLGKHGQMQKKIIRLILIYHMLWNNVSVLVFLDEFVNSFGGT